MPLPASPLIVQQAATAGAIASLLERRLSEHGFGPAPDPLREALVHIGARYGEILVERLNAAPELLREAFSAPLGGTAAPAVPAQVLLSFQPVMSRVAPQGPVVVPAHTTAAAPAVEGDSEPVVFETLADLELVRVEPACALLLDPQRLAIADVSDLLSRPGREAELLSGALPAELALHMPVPAVLAGVPLSRLSVALEVLRAGRKPPDAIVEWGMQTPGGFVALAVRSDTTMHLEQSGVVELVPPMQWPVHTQGGITSRWLSCRLRPGEAAMPAGLAYEPPGLGSLRLRAAAQMADVGPEVAFSGPVPLDTSKDYFPFGERPRFGDVFLLSAPAFAQAGARVTLVLRLTNPAGLVDGPLPPVRREGKPRLAWEMHTRRGWVALAAADETLSLTQDGSVSFVVPDDVLALAIGGRSGAWVRARLAAGHYGAPQTVDGIMFPAAPSIASAIVRAEVEIGPVAPAPLLRAGPLDIVVIDAASTPVHDAFARLDAAGPVLYLGLASHEASVARRTLSMLVHAAPAPGRVVWRGPEAGTGAALPRWQVLAEEGWSDVSVRDETRGLSRTGLVRLQLGAEPSTWAGSRFDGGRQLAWLRVAWPPGAPLPRLRRLVPNSVQARQTLRLENEVLGSSNGRPSQAFNALRTPVVGDVVVEVREAFDDEPWTRWLRVDDLDASDSGSRHFTLERSSGCITFGDGKHGRIPPPGPNNIRLREYHAGGGRRGNRPPATVTQLRRAIAYVEGVTNWVPAAGGRDAADAQAVRAGASAWLRHRDRAVCAEDYADLARAASREVARAYCHACRDVSAPPGSGMPAAGRVSVVIVPVGDEACPQPSPELLGQVKAHLDARRPPATELVVAGPHYASLRVKAQIRCTAGRSAHEIALACRRCLQAFLHPVNGGERRCGWAPGERPHRSDLVALLGAVEGVERVDALALRVDEPAPDEARIALVCAGELEVLAEVAS